MSPQSGRHAAPQYLSVRRLRLRLRCVRVRVLRIILSSCCRTAKPSLPAATYLPTWCPRPPRRRQRATNRVGFHPFGIVARKGSGSFLPDGDTEEGEKKSEHGDRNRFRPRNVHVSSIISLLTLLHFCFNSRPTSTLTCSTFFA